MNRRFRHLSVRDSVRESASESVREMDGGFTLLELMVSVTLALALTTMAMVAFFNIRKLINRAEARLAMHSAAQTIYNAWYRSFTGMQQTCAFVVASTANTSSAGSPPNDQVSIVFMHGKEDTQDWEWGTRSYTGQSYKSTMNSDLLWEMWTWKDSTKTIYSATSSPYRMFTTNGFTPFGGVTYNGQPFDIVPQPRRTLSTSTATSWQRSLNDNIMFPDPSSPDLDNPASLASRSDLGDYEDLRYKLAPALTQVTAFSVQLVPHDGAPADTILVEGSAASTPNLTKVLNGVWLDGRLAPTLTAAPDFATSDAAKRPKLIRLRFTLTDPRIGLSQTFSFSFALPALAPAP